MADSIKNLKIFELIQILEKRTILLTGGRDRNGDPIIHFPDTSERDLIKPKEYAAIITYFLEISTVRKKPFRFTIIFDVRESDHINSLLLKTLQKEFYRWIKRVIIIRNTGSKLKKLSIISENANEMYHINTEIIYHVELPALICLNQITRDLGGTFKYNHEQWIDYRADTDYFISDADILIGKLNNLNVHLIRNIYLNDKINVNVELEQHNDLRKEMNSNVSWVYLLCDRIFKKMYTDLRLPPSIKYAPLIECMRDCYARIYLEYPNLFDILDQVTDKLEEVVRVHRDVRKRWQQKYVSFRVRVFEHKYEHLCEWIEFNRDLFKNTHSSFGYCYNSAKINQEEHQQKMIDMIMKSVEYNQLLQYAEYFHKINHYSMPTIDKCVKGLKTLWEHYAMCLENRTTVLAKSIRFFQESERFSGCVTAFTIAYKISKLSNSHNVNIAMKPHRMLKNAMLKIYKKFHEIAKDLLNEIDQLIQIFNDPSDNLASLVEYEKLVEIILKVIVTNVDQNRELEKQWDEKESELLHEFETKTFTVNIENVLQWITDYGDPFLEKNTNIGTNLEQAKQLLSTHDYFVKIAEITYQNAQHLIGNAEVFIGSTTNNFATKSMVEELKYRLNVFWERVRYRRIQLENSILKNYNKRKLGIRNSN